MKALSEMKNKKSRRFAENQEFFSMYKLKFEENL